MVVLAQPRSKAGAGPALGSQTVGNHSVSVCMLGVNFSKAIKD